MCLTGGDNADEFDMLMDVNMAAFMELEAKLEEAAGGGGDEESDEGCGPQPAERPERPGDGECCQRACARCVWTVYGENLRRWESAHAGSASTSSVGAANLSHYATAPVPHTQPVETPYMRVHARRCARPAPGICRVAFDLGAAGLAYSTADTLLVRTPNSEDIVQRVAARLAVRSGGAGDHSCESGVASGSRSGSFSGVGAADMDRDGVGTTPSGLPLTTLTELRWRVELCAPPPRALYEAMLTEGVWEDSAAALAQREDLVRRLVRDSYRQEYRGAARAQAPDTQAQVPLTNVAEVLEHCSGCALPLATLFGALGERAPRAYSTCSSAEEAPHVAEVAFRVVGSATEHMTELTDGHLNRAAGADAATAAHGAMLDVAVRRSAFALPPAGTDGCGALVLIGAGTGVAPFRALLREVLARATTAHAASGAGSSLGGVRGARRVLLLAGCRTAAELPFGDELREMACSDQRGDSLSCTARTPSKDKCAAALDLTLLTAVSRPAPGAPVTALPKGAYVQDLIESNDAELWAHLSCSDTYVYVCGGTAMGQGVQEALCAVAERRGGLAESAAREWLSQMRASGRYVAELWG